MKDDKGLAKAVELSVKNDYGAELDDVGKWHGYDVYSPLVDEGAKVGEPIYILVKAGKARFAEMGEVFDIFDALELGAED